MVMIKRMMPLLIILSIIFCAFPQNVNAAKCGGVETNIINCEDADSSSGNIKKNPIFVLISKAIVMLSGLVGLIAVVMLIIAGFIYATAGEKSDQVSKAKSMMYNTLLGVILYLFMWLILDFFIPGGIKL